MSAGDQLLGNHYVLFYAEPVSYTHLDVYKRQPLADPSLFGSRQQPLA